MNTVTRAIAILSLIAVVCGACAAGDIEVVNGLTQEIVLQSGAKKEGKIVLRNNADGPREVKVFQTDYTFRCDGTNLYDKPGACPRSNCSWITFSPQQFSIPAKETLTVHYVVQVPKDDKLVGTYWSMLMVEPKPIPDPALSQSGSGKAMLSVQTVLRYGIQMVVHIGNTGKRDLKVVDKRLATTEGKRVLQLDIENCGERWLRPNIWAEVYDDKGAHVGKFQCLRTRIYPGCSTRNCIDLSSLKAGKYQALTVIDNGDESVWGAQYALEIQ